jgi:mannose-6-phosphate isomerase-like protein (cupin superfamily)
MVSILEGEAEITVSGKSLTMKAGEMITVPAKKPYALKANRRFKAIMVMMK